ncbi:hypothetical protein GGI12_003984 [Dipsacomyces acuminosporus]|nr:hypothetical protein GGI12_003984 [Dipsacomyces acuminosporus]
MCIKSVTTPYLITRSQDPVAPLSDDLSVTINGSDVGELKDTDTLDTIFLDYVKNACTVYKYTRLTGDVMKNDIPPMFISYSVVICGGIFASIAYAAPTKQLRETFRGYAELMKKLCRDFSHKTLLFADALKDIEKVEEMVRFLPRRLSVDQLLRIRKILIPSRIESLVGKKFCSFIDPIRRIAQLPHSVSNNSSMDWFSSLSSPSPSLSEKHLSPSSNMSHLANLPRSPSPLNLNGNNGSCSANTAGRSGNGSSSSNGGGIPLTSNLCAIFGRHMHHHYHHQAIFGGSGIKRTGTNSSADSGDINSVDDELFPGSYKGQQPPRALDGSCKMPKAAKLPDYKLTFISISSLFVALTIATKDEPFFEAAMDDMAYDIRSPFIDNNSPPKMEQDDNQLGIQMDAVHSSNSDKMDEDSDQKSVDSSLRSRSCLFTRIWQGVSSVAATYNNARNDVPSSPLSHGSGEKSSWLSHRVDAMRIQGDTPSVNKNADMGGSLQQQQQQQQQNSIKSSLSDLLN